MDDLEFLRTSIADVLAQDCTARALHDHVDGRGGNLAGDLRARAGELGWLAVGLSERSGGIGLGLAGAAMLSRELGRKLGPGCFLATLACLDAIDRFAPADVADRLLPGLLSGERCAAVPAAFGAGSSGWILGEIEPGSVVLMDDAGGLAIALATGAGKPVDQRGTHDRTRALYDRPVDTEVLAALPSEAMGHLETCANLLVAADALGAMEGLFALTLDYLKQREQFGVPIGSFQALKHRMADLSAQIELADCLFEQALAAATESAAEAAFWSALCKAEVTEAGAVLAAECVQLHGAIGFTWEHDCHLYMKRIRLDQALVRPNHALRLTGFDTFAAASAQGRSLMDIGR